MDRSWMQLHNRRSPRYIDGMREFIMFAHDYMKPDKSLLGAELRNIKGQVLTSGSSSKQPVRKQFLDSASFSDSESTEASTSISMDELCAVDSASVPSTSRATEVDIKGVFVLCSGQKLLKVVNRRAWYDATKLTIEVLSLYKVRNFLERCKIWSKNSRT
ncbi:hypothetical protein CsSME_00032504 [Camellia sinensis var. sinensis]